MKKFLHVGCGANEKNRTTKEFNSDDWIEVRFDIDASVHPDVIGTMTDLSMIASQSIDAIFSSHNIEHLYPHEVPVALEEFVRVLNQNGYLVITCPDLQSIAALVAEDRLIEKAYDSPGGPIAPIDVLFGWRKELAKGNYYMAHRCGFTQRVLVGTLKAAGFNSIASTKRPAPFFDLWALASKEKLSEADTTALAKLHLPH